MAQREWTIEGLYRTLQDDLTFCWNELERSCCKAIAGKEIRERAQAIASTRSLTLRERDIAQRFGYLEVRHAS
jgi:hypothetical protein